jgi:hypothetical protein
MSKPTSAYVRSLENIATLTVLTVFLLLELWEAVKYFYHRIIPPGSGSFLASILAWLGENRPAQYMLLVVGLLLILAAGLACIWRFVLERK